LWKVTGSKSRRYKKASHVEGWCGPGRVQSPGDLDGLDAPGSWFLRPKANHAS